MWGLIFYKLLDTIQLFWGSETMKTKRSGFAKGTATGIIAGVAVAALGTKMMKENKHLRRSAGRMAQSMGSMLDDMHVSFKN